MDSKEQLRVATEEELKQTLAFALSFDGRKRVHSANEFMANITADRLMDHLASSGFVVMKKPPPSAPSTSARPNSYLKD